ncbi:MULTISPECIES: RHS repeat-associated core domain-containing protein [unclassified Colwellia]|uniref:RHS repeat-associated core domain-containing protein n=1 Tax=unclassified Colwellia TaxID=196834 RepID=UPI001C70EDB6|nr:MULTISPECIES: RHS repeat-associated core domain-containing protein [unclassified Colwellia]
MFFESKKLTKPPIITFGETIGTQSDDVGYTGHKFDTDIGLSYMQARYYDPVIGRFYSNDPVGFTGEVDTFNRYSYVANNPYKYTDPAGEAKVYTWNAGKKANGENSIAGHAATMTNNGTYVSKFPTNGNGSPAEFHTYEQDVAIYGREPDVIIDVKPPGIGAANDFAKNLISDSDQEWSINNNCADAAVSVINSGG